MSAIAIIDYGLCNLDSIRRAIELCGGDVAVTDDAETVTSASRVILPGVGSFGVAMDNLRKKALDRALNSVVARGTPLLGICLGMQLLASNSTEGGHSVGLGLIPGRVIALDGARFGNRVPHIGWNNVHKRQAPGPILDGVADGANFYFVHSYHFVPDEDHHIAGSTPYCGDFVSVVFHNNIVGTQFHPEKSQRVGFQLLKNFLAWQPC